MWEVAYNKSTFFSQKLKGYVVSYFDFYFGGSGSLKKLKRGKPKSALGKLSEALLH